tara:strand:- start:1680 stop:1907 length:228 start_codon:yes stop_codon:yes gene_type:complete
MGITTMRLIKGCKLRLVEIVKPRKAERIIKSPWAIFTSLITPKINERPAANKAYKPPTNIPCIIELIQSINYTPK